MTIHSDAVSEKYRKYIVKCITGPKKTLYLFWGTNLQNEDQDYFLLNDNKNILAFTKIKDLVQYPNINSAAIDPENTARWAEAYWANKAYALRLTSYQKHHFVN